MKNIAPYLHKFLSDSELCPPYGKESFLKDLELLSTSKTHDIDKEREEIDYSKAKDLLESH